MIRSRFTVRFAAAAALSFTTLGLAAPAAFADQATATKKLPAAVAPAPKVGKDGQPEKRFISMHEAFLDIAKKGGVDVLFLGDSITEGWGGAQGGVGERTSSRSSPPTSASAATAPSTCCGASRTASSTASRPRSWC